MNTKKLDYPNVVEVTEKCLKFIDLDYIELHITPLRVGYRVEVIPPKPRNVLEKLATCVSNRLGVAVKVEERVYGTILVVKA